MHAFGQNLNYALPQMAKTLPQHYASVIIFSDEVFIFYLLSEGTNIKYKLERFKTQDEAELKRFYFTYRSYLKCL